jgi:uncharacterized protein
MKRRSALASAVGTLLSASVARAERKRANDSPPGELRDAFEQTEHEVILASLRPEHDGLRIAQLTDLHMGRDVPDSRIIGAVQAVNAAAPDLVVLTGDYITHQGDDVDVISTLLKGLRVPAVAVLGNHDHWTHPKEIKRALQSVGIEVLQNQCTQKQLRGVAFDIVGVDDGVSKNANIARSFAGTSSHASQLCLAHSPATFDDLPSAHGLLCLSGHTHGGQWYVEGVSERLFAKAGQPYVRGHHARGRNQLYVSRGLGFGRSTRMPRVNAEPEVAMMTLRSPSFG